MKPQYFYSKGLALMPIFLIIASITVLILAVIASQTVLPRRQPYLPPSLSPEPGAEAILQTYARPPATTNVAAWIPYWDQAAALASLQKFADKVDYTILFWYMLGADGSVAPYGGAGSPQSVIDVARPGGSKVLISVANLSSDEVGKWDPQRVGLVIQDQASRARHIASLSDLVNSTGADGLVIDYEALLPSQRQNFTLFIQELSQEMHQQGKLVGVTLAPKDADMNPALSNGSDAQDWLALQQYADQLYLMSYDQHWITSSPGPIASLPWLQGVVTYARSRIPQDKLFVGLPLYGYDWSNAPQAQGLEYTDVLRLLGRTGSMVQWDQQAGSHYFVYQDARGSHTVWFEDANSIEAKMALLHRLNIQNFFLWRLGGEDVRVWEQL